MVSHVTELCTITYMCIKTESSHKTYQKCSSAVNKPLLNMNKIIFYLFFIIFFINDF